jgi:hypothetical protein
MRLNVKDKPFTRTIGFGNSELMNDNSVHTPNRADCSADVHTMN